MDSSEGAHAERIQMLWCEGVTIAYLEGFKLFQELRLISSLPSIPPELILQLFERPQEGFPKVHVDVDARSVWVAIRMAGSCVGGPGPTFNYRPA